MKTLTVEREMLDGRSALNNQTLGFTETMTEDFVSICERKSSLAENAAALTERHLLLERLVQGIGGKDVGTSMDELAARIDELDSCIDEYARECGEIATQSQRLAQRAQDRDRGEPLDEVLSRTEAAKVSPELGRLAKGRESEIANEFDDYFDEMTAQIRREAQARSQQRRSENEEAARTIRQKADDALAAHESEQQRLDAEIEAKRMPCHSIIPMGRTALFRPTPSPTYSSCGHPLQIRGRCPPMPRDRFQPKFM